MDCSRMTSPELIELLVRDFQIGDAGGEELYRAASELARREDPAVSAGRAWAVFREKYLPAPRQRLYSRCIPRCPLRMIPRGTGTSGLERLWRYRLTAG